MDISQQLYIDGAWRDGQGAPFASRSPATREVVWEGASASAEDVERAVMAARRAFGAFAMRVARLWDGQRLCSVYTNAGRRERGIDRTSTRAWAAGTGEWAWTTSNEPSSMSRPSRRSHRGSGLWLFASGEARDVGADVAAGCGHARRHVGRL